MIAIFYRTHDLQSFIIDQQRLTAGHSRHLRDAPGNGPCFQLRSLALGSLQLQKRQLTPSAASAPDPGQSPLVDQQQLRRKISLPGLSLQLPGSSLPYTSSARSS